ncbi:dihydrofolate reductase family protein [Nocardia sp. NBC_00565]|uniref:dihydrofolate reductase family protein n=1 Tax=Nocardia sp. NBC_00565 TaxID=2975993 RepID=UPI002E7FB645|nr:dihydrofolate reductase family protein [Nocardia sp. NBC_00565]WUB99978.1 dihydrofolate reductase family protein [Nocardia sp. NBC_00565]
MRDLIVTENITLDGVIDATEGWFTVGNDQDQSDILEELMRQTAQCDAVLFGRVTFEEMRGYWPQQTDDETGITDDLNNTMKYVVSGTLGDPQWQNTTVLRGPLTDDIRALKAERGKDIVTTGSITLVHELIAQGLVDEYRLFVFPVVLGKGSRLFPDGTKIPDLHLTETRQFRSGVVLLRYRPH